MKSLIWIFNSLLLLVLSSLIIYIGVYRDRLPKSEPIKPIAIELEAYKQEVPKANIKRIYERDLFGTYRPEQAAKKETVKKREIKSIPAPPAEKALDKKIPNKIEFLKPLNITLRGIIFSNPELAQAIIENNDTKEEGLYKSGDKLFDAHILRIFKDKIVILRSNGQQEIIYSNKEQAKRAIEKMKESNWNDIIEQKTETYYLIDPNNFVKRINNLAEFIDMLDLTTAFKDGRNIGLRIGYIKEGSLGKAIGLNTGDIILSIDDIVPTSTQNRVDIYNKIIKNKINDVIKLKIHRDKNIIINSYIFKEIKSTKEDNQPIKKQSEKNNNSIENIEQKIKILESKSNLNSVDKTIRRNDRKSMLKQGSKDAILDNLVI